MRCGAVISTHLAPAAITIWNGAAVSTKMLGKATDVTYTDPASGEADTLDISIHDRDRKWISAWLPVEGDTMTAVIRTVNNEREGARRSLSCGLFIMDDFSFSGWPITGTISGVSTPQDSNFKATERTKTWENVTIEEIGKEIAKRAGIALTWDVEGEPFTIQSIEQTEQSDCEFYMSLCDTYGLAMKTIFTISAWNTLTRTEAWQKSTDNSVRFLSAVMQLAFSELSTLPMIFIASS